MKNQKKQLLRNNTILTNKENKDLHINLKQELYIPDNGKEALEMVKENKVGQMELAILVNGKKTELMEREDLYMWMGIFMMGYGPTIKLTDMGSINMLMEHNMRESGKMIYNTEKGLKLGPMDRDMKATMHLEGSMDLVLINGMTDLNILENGKRTKYLDLEYTLG